jgi:hypothetical protein
MRLPFVGAPGGPAGSFTSGAATAAARAREVPVAAVPETVPVTAPQKSPVTTPHKAEDLFEKPAESSHAAVPASTESASSAFTSAAPTFSFGGANAFEESSGGGKKIVFGIVAAMIVCGGAYLGWNHFHRLNCEYRPTRAAEIYCSYTRSDFVASNADGSRHGTICHWTDGPSR